MVSSAYDKIKAPPKRCENCINGTMFVNAQGDEWRDVYRCSLDGYLKDYRVTCDQWKASNPGADSSGVSATEPGNSFQHDEERP